jgi:rhamnosyltransferase
MTDFTVAVILPVYRPGKAFSELLRRLSLQTKVPDRVLILNTVEEETDEDAVLTLMEQYRDSFPVLSALHVDKEEFDHGGTRDLGIRMVGTDLCLLMTQDALPRDRKLIEHLSAYFVNPRVSAAYGRQLASRKQGPLEHFARSFNYPEKSMVKSREDMKELGIKTFFCSDVCAMWRREIYLKLGGFEHPVIFNEDMILAGQEILAGYQIAYAADAAVYHGHNYSGRQQLQRNFDLAVSQADHPEIFDLVSSQKEGIRFVLEAAKTLARSGEIRYLPALFLESACKILGYRLGKRYRLLPSKWILSLTNNRAYWKKKWGE